MQQQLNEQLHRQHQLQNPSEAQDKSLSNNLIQNNFNNEGTPEEYDTEDTNEVGLSTSFELNDEDLKDIESEIRAVVDLVKRRPKERRIRDVLTLIKLRNSIKLKKKLKYFKDAEKIMMRFGVSMKSFRDYNTEIRIAEKFGFEIEKNIDKGFGIIREFNDLLLK